MNAVTDFRRDRSAGIPARRRGMALLLVMIGLVVCTVLTAGFLATQGTSIGIARNERDAVKAHAIAQTGIDMCYWLIRNKPDWRETMFPGNWLSNTPVGDGTASVYVDDDTHNFADDPTTPVTLTSTGAFDNRLFALTATIRPTGGGTVFQSGNFSNGKILLGNTDLVTIATIDSYNSSIAPYNASQQGTNASFNSNTTANGDLTVYYPSTFRGSYTGGPTALLGNVVTLVGAAPGPSALAKATEWRNPGTVVFPNTASLPSCGTAVYNNIPMPPPLSAPGFYSDITANNSTLAISASGTYYVTNNVTVGSAVASYLNVNENVNATLVVNGNLTVTSGKIQLLGNYSRLTIYVLGNITVTGGINVNGSTSRLAIYGGSNSGNLQITGSGGSITGAVYAPAHDMTMQTGGPKFFGAAVVKSLTIKNTAGFHFDEALRTLKISNITGGSAPSGTADYRVAITGGPGIQR